MPKKIVYIDMDNVLVDFGSGINRLDAHTKQEYSDHLDDVPGIFSLMDPIPGAIEAVRKLREHFELYILSTAPWNNPSAWCDKLLWVKKHFGGNKGDVFYKRIILSHHKNLCHGDFLIDDRPNRCGVDKFTGEVIFFDPNNADARFHTWDEVVNYLILLK